MRNYPLAKEFSLALFQNPPKQYRGAPFWAWNGDLHREKLLRQIDVLKQMGFGGFHIHSRTGMNVPYPSKKFLGLVKDCVQKGREKDLLTWLYDEDRWPSGFAGGLVTKNPQYRARHLLFTTQKKKLVEKDGVCMLVA